MNLPGTYLKKDIDLISLKTSICHVTSMHQSQCVRFATRNVI